MKKTLVFILSTNHSGSHFLSLLLGSNSRAMHLGEVHRLRKAPPDRSCHTCGTEKMCPVLSGIYPHNIDQVYDRIFLNSSSDIQALIDTSKFPSWAGRFLGKGGYAMKYIHLIRDPRAHMRKLTLDNPTLQRQLKQRWKIMRVYPRFAPLLFFSGQTVAYLYKWLGENQVITRFIRQNRLDACLVTYEDLARNTSGEVRRLVEWVGLEYEPAQLDYWNFEHHGTTKRNLEDHPSFDLRWKTSLSVEACNQVVRNERIRTYVDGLGLGFDDQGLTRVSSHQ